MASQTVAAYMLSRLHRMEQATSMAKALLGGDPNAGASSGNP